MDITCWGSKLNSGYRFLRMKTGAWALACALALVGRLFCSDLKRYHTATVRVDGMVCYSCSYAMEKNCKYKELGKQYKMDLKNGLFTIKLAQDEKLPEPKELRRIVQDSGFTYRGASLQLTGKLIFQGSNASVTNSATGQTFTVREDSKSAGRFSGGSAEQTIVLKTRNQKQDAWELEAASPLRR